MFQKCIQWVDRTVIRCKAWGVKLDKKCTAWAEEKTKKCAQTAEQKTKKCTQTAEETTKRCDRWEEVKEKKCSKWKKKCGWKFWNCIIHWFCAGWYWVTKTVCKAWAWVTKIVCKAWTWIVKVVCIAWYWVSKWVCKAFAWVARTVCVMWGWLVRTFCWVVGWIVCLVTSLVNSLVVAVGKLVRRSTTDGPRVKKVFVLMLENRSYDHMLGFAALSGADADSGLPRTADGADPALHNNTNPATNATVPVGTGAPFKIVGDHHHEDPGHEFDHVVVQLAGKGATYSTATGYPTVDMSGFVAAHVERGSVDPDSIMKSFSPRQLPVITELAREYAVCDRWFSSMPGPTWPNRFFAAAGSSAGLDDSPGSLEIVVNTFFDGYRFENGTIYDRLDGKCRPWKIYHGDELPVSFALAGMSVNRLAGRFASMDDFAFDVSDPDFEPEFVFIEPHYGNILPLTPEDYTCGTSQHPLDDVTRGEQLIKDVYDAIRNSPHWEESVLIVTWDEHGGFYDHVEPPATVAPGDAVGDPDNNQHDFDFTQLGVRVPAVVVSPLIERGVVDHRVYDHSSIPATVERLFGLKAMTKRDAAANDVLHLLSRSTPRPDAPATMPAPAESGWTCESIFDVGLLPSEVTGGLTGAVDRPDPDRGDDVDVDPVAALEPHVAQAVILAAFARARTLGRWDAEGRLEVEDELRAIRSDLDARRFVLSARESVRAWQDTVGTRHPSDYRRLTERRDVEG